MESEKEWQFITNEIQNKTGSRYTEWFIGLKENSPTKSRDPPFPVLNFPIPILLFPKAAYRDHLTTDSPSTSVE